MTVKGAVRSIAVNRKGQVAVSTASNELYLLEEQSMCATARGGIAAAQVGAKTLKFFWLIDDCDRCFELDVDLPVRSLLVDVEGKCVAICLTGSKDTEFYKVGQSSVVSFKSQPLEVSGERLFAVRRFTVYYVRLVVADGTSQLSLVVLDLQNDTETVHPLITDKPNPQDPLSVMLLDLNANHLLIVFQHRSNYLYLTCEIGEEKFEMKSALTQISVNTETIKSVRINCTGTLIAVCDSYQIFVLRVGDNSATHNASIPTKNTIDILWASNEGRLFAFKEEELTNIIMCAETVDAEIAIRQYDQLEGKSDAQLLAFDVPNLFYLECADFVTVSKQTLNEFKGLSIQTIKIMIDFLTTPNLDLNQMIKTINRLGENNAKLWTNLARISVKCRDVKMGLYCITKLKNARVANDVKRELQSTNDENCGLAVLAINLQLYTEAEELLKQSSNKLALSRFYQNRNEWDKAIACVDKVNQKTVYYNYAKHLENEEGNIQEAVKYYEKSNTHLFEVPRMLFDMDGNSMLQRYCLGSASSKTSKDPQLVRWWGQYCESLGDINQALTAYEKANDYYHLVRLLCYTGETEKAKSVVSGVGGGPDADNHTRGSRDAALLHLGRHLEASNANESISYYLSCGAIKHALRVCRNNGLIDELIKITVNHGSKADAKELISKYSEFADDADVSRDTIVQLYHKCDQSAKAIELSIRYRTWSQLRDMLRQEMDTERSASDKAAVNEQNLELALHALREDADIIDIVIDMLLLAKSERLNILENLLTEYNVEINERLIDKVERVAARSGSGNHKLAAALAEMALRQGKYVIAAKLFNSLGDRSGSIKALIRTGETEKVINYANIARDKAVFRIAANYLQTVNYEDAKVIETFYKKAGAKQELDRFMKKE